MGLPFKIPFLHIPELVIPDFRPRHHLGRDPELTSKEIDAYDAIDILQQMSEWGVNSAKENRELLKDNRTLIVIVFIMVLLTNGPQLAEIVQGWLK
jgi:hypothetical protein